MTHQFPTFEQYLRHARRFGSELVFETAAGLVWPFEPDLNVRELGALSLRLQHLDPTWRLPKADDGKFEVHGVDRVLFALELVAAKCSRDDACAAAMISRATLQRELRRSSRPPKWAASREVPVETQDVAKQAPEAAFPSGVDVSFGRPQGPCLGEPDLTHDGGEMGRG